MVFRRRAETTTNELNRWDLEYLQSLECGTKVYVPLWDKEGEIADVIEQYVCVEGILPNNEWLDLHPWEFQIVK
jgi:hypothetical protein